MSAALGPPTIVLFGLPGAFAERPLAALAAARLRPRLVVEGIEGGPVPRDDSRLFPAEPGPANRLVERVEGWARTTLLGSPAPTPGLVGAAHRLGIDAVRTRDANGPRVSRWLRTLRPDAFVVCGFPHPLAPRTLALAARGGLNLHPGRLPEERGPEPLFWALKAGRTTIGWTIHVLDRGEDSGDVVASGEVSFAPGARGADILEAVAEDARTALVRSLRSLLDGDLVRAPQPPPARPRSPRPGFRDGRIDPGRPAEAVYTFVAGCADRHPLFVESAGDRFFVADALGFDPARKLAFEYVLTGDRLLLRCQPGAVDLLLKEDGALFAPDY